jgi:hypothetical protein
MSIQDLPWARVQAQDAAVEAVTVRYRMQRTAPRLFRTPGPYHIAERGDTVSICGTLAILRPEKGLPLQLEAIGCVPCLEEFAEKVQPGPFHIRTVLSVPDSSKMLRETLCSAQAAIGARPFDEHRKRADLDRLQRLINECDRHRPLGVDGKHGDRHTPTCGCDTVGWSAWG